MRMIAIAVLVLLVLPVGVGCANHNAGPLAESMDSATTLENPDRSQSVSETGPSPVSTPPNGLTTYTDRRNRFVIRYPAWWQETNLRQLGDADVYGFEVVGFADHDGPGVDGCYANMMQVNTLEDRTYDASLLERLPETLPQSLERLSAKNDDVAVLVPWTETRIAGAPAMAMTLSISDRGLDSTGLDCVLVADQRLYELEFFTVSADWAEYEPIFHQILAEFKAGVD